jgi:hypothetical protein
MLPIKAHIATDPLSNIEIAENDKVRAAAGKAKLHKIVTPARISACAPASC